MCNDSKPNSNAFHYIVVGVFGLFAGSFTGFLLCAATQSPNDQVLLHFVLWGGVLGAAGLPALLRRLSS